MKYGSIDITIHIYNNPKNKKGSKLMLQGSSQTLLCSYVFDELPKIYKVVCESISIRDIEDITKVKKKMPEKSLVKCNQCKFKANMIQMKMHIQNMLMDFQSCVLYSVLWWTCILLKICILKSLFVTVCWLHHSNIYSWKIAKISILILVLV